MKERSKRVATRRKLYLIGCRLMQITLFCMVVMGLILFASESPSEKLILVHAVKGAVLMLFGGYGIAFVDTKM